MTSDKMIARTVGALFATTMIAGFIDSSVAMPVLGLPFAGILANQAKVSLGVFMTLYMSLGVVGIALLLHPVVKRHNALIASAYVSFRIIECVFLIAGAVVPLFLLALSQEFVKSGGNDPQWFQSVSALAIKLRGSTFQIAMAILGFNSLALCGLLYRTRLVPRWLAALGLVGYAGLLASAALDLASILDATNGAGRLLYIPGGVFELILFPAWLIIKGFNDKAGA